MNAECPHCGTPSGPFTDPRTKMGAAGVLGEYRCAVCGRYSHLAEVLEAADDRTLREWLDGPAT